MVAAAVEAVAFPALLVVDEVVDPRIDLLREFNTGFTVTASSLDAPKMKAKHENTPDQRVIFLDPTFG